MSLGNRPEDGRFLRYASDVGSSGLVGSTPFAVRVVIFMFYKYLMFCVDIGLHFLLGRIGIIIMLFTSTVAACDAICS